RCYRHIRDLVDVLIEELKRIHGVQLYGPPSFSARVGLVSLNVAAYDPQELAALLDAQWSIQARAGLHCAPRMHAALGTLPRGTLRLSLGHFTNRGEIEAAIAALSEVAGG